MRLPDGIDVPPQGRIDDGVVNGLPGFVGAHSGRRCFIAGNGPSLNRLDMGLLKDEITFGSNRCYLGFEGWGVTFTYWGIEDYLQIKQGFDWYNRDLPGPMTKFVPIQYAYLFTVPNVVPVEFEYNYEPFPQFSTDPKVLYAGWTVTYMLLQIAAMMGCSPIYLIGIDHRYDIGEKERRDGRWSDCESKSHFTKDYCADEEKVVWNTPKPEKSEQAYACARAWGERNGVRILNATPDTGLDVFEKVDYESLF